MLGSCRDGSSQHLYSVVSRLTGCFIVPLPPPLSKSVCSLQVNHSIAPVDLSVPVLDADGLWGSGRMLLSLSHYPACYVASYRRRCHFILLAFDWRPCDVSSSPRLVGSLGVCIYLDGELGAFTPVSMEIQPPCKCAYTRHVSFPFHPTVSTWKPCLL